MSDARSKHLLFSVITAGLSIGVLLAGAETRLRTPGRGP